MDYLHTPKLLTEHIIEYRDCPLHYWLAGDTDKPLIVMTHGATMDHRMFNAQVVALLDNYRVLVWDARGHGKSQPGGSDLSLELFTEDMLRILDHVQAEKFVTVGQSLGGYVAQHLYMRVPDRVHAMVVVGSTPIWKAYSRAEVWALKASLPLFNLWPYNSFTKLIANSTAVKEPVRQYALEAARCIPKDQFVRIWKAVTMSVNTQGLPSTRFNVPLLLMHGEKDKTGTIKRDMPYWAKEEAHAEYHVIPNAGHNANQDNPDVVNELLRTFLERHCGPV